MRAYHIINQSVLWLQSSDTYKIAIFQYHYNSVCTTVQHCDYVHAELMYGHRP